MPVLTSLNAVKTWMTLPTATDDQLLTSLIQQISGAIQNYIQRPALALASYTDLQSGVGNQRLMLRNWPVLAVTSLQVGNLSIPAAQSFGQVGYTLGTWDGTPSGNPQEITLNGYCFTKGLNNIQIIYQAGYCIQNEAQTVPASGALVVTPQQPLGNWSQDDGVTYANGSALTPVASSPAAGQYIPPSFTDPANQIPCYQFSAADAGAPLLLSYSYTPAALEQACIEWISERYKYKDRIGQASQRVGGTETTAYSLKMPEHIQIVLAAFQKWLPL